MVLLSLGFITWSTEANFCAQSLQTFVLKVGQATQSTLAFSFLEFGLLWNWLKNHCSFMSPFKTEAATSPRRQEWQLRIMLAWNGSSALKFQPLEVRNIWIGASMRAVSWGVRRGRRTGGERYGETFLIMAQVSGGMASVLTLVTDCLLPCYCW